MARKSNSARWIIGISIIGIAVVTISLVQLGDNVVYFYTPGEAVTKAPDLKGKNIKVGGMVVAGSVLWKAEDLALSFTLSDLKGAEISVAHKGTPPDMFKENQGVVVEGTISSDGKSMQSKHLLVKHSEEYKSTGDHSTMEKTLLEKSIFKEQKP